MKGKIQYTQVKNDLPRWNALLAKQRERERLNHDKRKHDYQGKDKTK